MSVFDEIRQVVNRVEELAAHAKEAPGRNFDEQQKKALDAMFVRALVEQLYRMIHKKGAKPK